MNATQKADRLEQLIEMSQAQQQENLWGASPPRDGWSSWDSHPWSHPWLTPSNLELVREYSARQRRRWIKAASRLPDEGKKYGFVGNMANNQYMRAKPLRKRGLDIDVVLHPHDGYIISQPGWEEFDGILPTQNGHFPDFVANGGALPDVAGVRCPSVGHCKDVKSAFEFFSHLEPEDILRFLPYLVDGEMYEVLKEYDSLLCAQIVYLGMLSGQPYIATQCGGDIWYECSRADVLGRLQKEAYQRASVVFATNPWSFAHARRYSMRHFVYVPLILDDQYYSPGLSDHREQWQAEIGGDFFVFSAVRLNDQVKGTHVAIEGFARFAAQHPNVRLVLASWGQDTKLYPQRFQELGIADKVLVVPVAGKKRVIEYLRSADCTLDQFSIGYYGASALEGMACGAPVIMRIEKQQYDALLQTGSPPVLNASKAGEVADHLSLLYENPIERQNIAKAQRDWVVVSHGAEAWAATYSAALRLTAAGKRFGCFWSPLRKRLNDDEKDYHAEQLAQAPIFPNYQ